MLNLYPRSVSAVLSTDTSVVLVRHGCWTCTTIQGMIGAKYYLLEHLSQALGCMSCIKFTVKGSTIQSLIIFLGVHIH